MAWRCEATGSSGRAVLEPSLNAGQCGVINGGRRDRPAHVSIAPTATLHLLVWHVKACCSTADDGRSNWVVAYVG
jgi:hypothetical protein